MTMPFTTSCALRDRTSSDECFCSAAIAWLELFVQKTGDKATASAELCHDSAFYKLLGLQLLGQRALMKLVSQLSEQV